MAGCYLLSSCGLQLASDQILLHYLVVDIEGLMESMAMARNKGSTIDRGTSFVFEVHTKRWMSFRLNFPMLLSFGACDQML
jgi:hypothetical protein